MDTKEIKELVKKVLDTSNDMDIKVDKLMEGWELNKESIKKDFGDRLMVESSSTLSIEKPLEDKTLEFRLYVDDIAFETIDEELRCFLLEQGVDGFFSNSTKENWYKYGYKINKGMKISRALKFFIKDKQILDKWQIKYSRILQDNKISGKLCLSIHPLDFLSMSENAHNWRSCHSLDGDYRAGNLSYMVDGTTIVAFLKAEGNYQLPNFPRDLLWNSKKWRMLMYINEDRDLIFTSKPYPFDNETLVKASYDMLQNIFHNSSWQDNYNTIDPDVAMEYVGDSLGALQYNDCISSATYDPRYKTLVGKELEDCKEMEIGSPVLCLECEEDYIEFGADYFCSCCGEYVTCEECGCNVYTEEAYPLEKSIICAGCYDELATWCNGCGENFSRENPELTYDEESDEWYCPCCYDSSLSLTD